MKIKNGKITELERGDIKCFDMTVSEGVTTLTRDIMKDLHSSVCHMSLPMSLHKIEDSCMEGWKQLRDLNLSENVSYLGKRAVKNNSYNFQSFKLSPKMTTIEEETFMNCTYLFSQQAVVIPKNIKSIKARAFANCSNFYELVIYGDIEEIDETAFEGCTKLHRIVVRKNDREEVIENRLGFERIFVTKPSVKLTANQTIINHPGSIIVEYKKDGFLGEVASIMREAHKKQPVIISEKISNLA